MANVKAINLTDETYDIWKKKFKDTGMFSEWIQNKLIEEQNKEDSIEFIRNNIIKVTAEIEKLEADRRILEKRLQLKMDQEAVEANNLLKEIEQDRKVMDKLFEQLVQRVGARLEFKWKIVNKELSIKLAKQYAQTYQDVKEDDRPKVHVWLTDEIVNKARSEA